MKKCDAINFVRKIHLEADFSDMLTCKSRTFIHVAENSGVFSFFGLIAFRKHGKLSSINWKPGGRGSDGKMGRCEC